MYVANLYMNNRFSSQNAILFLIVTTHFVESAIRVSWNIFIDALMRPWAAAPGATAPSAHLRYATGSVVPWKRSGRKMPLNIICVHDAIDVRTNSFSPNDTKIGIATWRMKLKMLHCITLLLCNVIKVVKSHSLCDNVFRTFCLHVGNQAISLY